METWQLAVSGLISGGVVAAVLGFIYRMRKVGPTLAEQWDEVNDLRVKKMKEFFSEEIGSRDARLGRMEADLSLALKDRADAMSHRDKCEKELEKVRQSISELLLKMTDTLRGAEMWITESGIIMDAQTPVLTLFHYTREQLIGKNIEILVHPDVRERHRKALAAFSKERRHPRPWPIRAMGLRSDGEVVTVDVTILGAWLGPEGVGRVIHGRVTEAHESFQR